jgi:hypothetical protein
MEKSAQLVCEIHDLCKKYEATIIADGDLIIINVPGDRFVLHIKAITGERVEWGDLALREKPPCLN